MNVKKRYHWLADVINDHQFTIGAEIGAATGVTTGYLLSNCRTLKSLIIVDDWRPIPGSGQWEDDNMEAVFRKKFVGEERIKILKGLSWEMAEYVQNESLDFVFIDASHDYESVVKDLKAWIPKVHRAGLLTGHDLHFKGVPKALKETIPDYVVAGIDNCWFALKEDYL